MLVFGIALHVFFFKFYFHLFYKFPFDVIYSWSLRFISLTANNSGTIQKLPFGVNTTTELKNVTAASDNTGILAS